VWPRYDLLYHFQAALDLVWPRYDLLYHFGRQHPQVETAYGRRTKAGLAGGASAPSSARTRPTARPSVRAYRPR
jgi:hypothetical protein